MPLPAKLLEQGVRDMVRICDGRMSGTAYGTVVLHVSPEAAAGGPLALVRSGDPVHPRRAGPPSGDRHPARRAGRPVPAPAATAAYASPMRGWQSLYVDTVQQADTGADLSFLVGASGAEVTRESH